MAKLTKKDIYKSYGIEFQDGKILTPFGKWIMPLLPYGTNDKIGNCHSWSIYHGDEVLTPNDFKQGGKVAELMESLNIESIRASCPFHCPHCYCDYGNFQRYETAKYSAMLKLILARYYLTWLENAIKAQIKADNVKQLRIHVAGDFFSKPYAEMWARIAMEFPNVEFWTYTKYDFALALFANIENLHLVPSNTPCGFNYGTCAELLKMYHDLTAMGYRVHICACGTDYQNHCHECKHGCKAIGTECDFVLFIKHSDKSYKAGKKDKAEFAQVLEIIKAQEN